MAKKQTRRTFSVNRLLFEAVKREAERLDISVSQLVTEAMLVRLPKFKVRLKHAPIADVRKATATRKRGPMLKPKVNPGAPVIDIIEKHQRIHRVIDPGSQRARRASLAATREMRKRGILSPDREGYARGSWAAAGGSR